MVAYSHPSSIATDESYSILDIKARSIKNSCKVEEKLECHSSLKQLTHTDIGALNLVILAHPSSTMGEWIDLAIQNHSNSKREKYKVQVSLRL